MKKLIVKGNRTACGKAAALAVAFALTIGGAEAAPTAIYWKGGNGTANEPRDVFDMGNWARNSYEGETIGGSGHPYTAHNLNFNSAATAWLTNSNPSAATVAICTKWMMHNGVFSIVDGAAFKIATTLSIAYSSGEIGTLEVNGGTIAADSSIYVGQNGMGTLTINGGTVSSGVAANFGYASGCVGTLNLNGGTLIAPSLEVGSGSGEINFNGGVLQSTRTSDGVFIPASANLTVNVGSGGGTILTTNKAIRIAKAIGGTGRMTFAGTKSINFTENGSDSYWTGGTKVMLGATVQVEGTKTKGALLDNGLVVDGSTKDADGTFTVLQVKSGVGITLTDADLAHVSFVNCGNGTVARISDNKIIVDFTVPATEYTWTLDSSKNWSAFSGGAVLDEDGIVRITVTDPTAVLTVDENVTVAQIVFADGSGATLTVAEGKTVTAESISGIGKILNYGSVVKAGVGTISLPFDNASTGVTVVREGRINVSDKTCAGGEGSSQVVRVKRGATFDVQGVGGLNFNVVLEEGARFVNAGDGMRNNQAVSLALEGDATVYAWKNFGLVAPGHAATSLNLGTNTLAVTSRSGYLFLLDNTTITGTGTVLVDNGKLQVYGMPVTGAECTVSIGSNGALSLDENLTVSNFVNNGEITGGGTLTVTGTLTPGNAITNLTLASGSTVKMTGTNDVQMVTGTFSASGTVTIDTSVITAEDFRTAERIPVMTAPGRSTILNSAATWNLTTVPVDGYCARWRGDEGGATSTLYLCRPKGLVVSFH